MIGFSGRGTSVAAHVRDASLSRSDAEMCSRLEGAIQQADESMLCLEMLQDDCAINQSSLGYKNFARLVTFEFTP